jgi:hypothetical protein
VRPSVEPFAPSPARRVCGPSVCALAVGMALFLASGRVQADGLSDLEKAHNAYVAHKYDDAEARLRTLLDLRTGALQDPDNVADARMYLAASLLAQGKKAEAQAVFEQLLREKPDYQPDSLRVSLQATDALVDVRSRMREELAASLAEKVRQAQEARAKVESEKQKAALRFAMLEKLASEETLIQRNSRWVALVPFGVGQFQNGQTTLGWVFLTTESLLAIGSGVGAAAAYYNEVQANDALLQGDTVTAPQYQRLAQDAFVVGNVFAAGFALAGIAGIIHAEMTFVPERVEVRARPIPPLALTPMFLPAPGAPGRTEAARPWDGALVGVQGRF